MNHQLTIFLLILAVLLSACAICALILGARRERAIFNALRQPRAPLDTGGPHDPQSAQHWARELPPLPALPAGEAHAQELREATARFNEALHTRRYDEAARSASLLTLEELKEPADAPDLHASGTLHRKWVTLAELRGAATNYDTQDLNTTPTDNEAGIIERMEATQKTLGGLGDSEPIPGDPDGFQGLGPADQSASKDPKQIDPFAS